MAKKKFDKMRALSGNILDRIVNLDIRIILLQIGHKKISRIAKSLITLLLSDFISI